MSSFIHTIHEYIVLLIRYLAIFAVIGFMPIPLFTFFGGDSLSEVDYNPLFQYFNHYDITTDAILQSVYTNVYISENKDDIKQWDVDNAIIWADAVAFKLQDEHIPVVRDVFSSVSQSKIQSLQSLDKDETIDPSLLPQNIENILLSLKQKFETILPLGSVTQDARQWIILALNSNQKNIKKQLKSLVSQFPNDNFLVITQTPVSLNKKTLNLQLPNFNVKQAKRIISEGLKITEPQAEILLIENNKSLWSLNNENEESQQFSIKSLLGENYHSLSDISSKQAAILQKLCLSGKMKAGKKQLDLSEYGVIIKNKNYQWENEEALLNYKLQKQTLCGKGAWIDAQQSQVQTTQQTIREEVKQQINEDRKEFQQKSKKQSKNDDKEEKNENDKDKDEEKKQEKVKEEQKAQL